MSLCLWREHSKKTSFSSGPEILSDDIDKSKKTESRRENHIPKTFNEEEGGGCPCENTAELILRNPFRPTAKEEGVKGGRGLGDFCSKKQNRAGGEGGIVKAVSWEG